MWTSKHVEALKRAEALNYSGVCITGWHFIHYHNNSVQVVTIDIPIDIPLLATCVTMDEYMARA